MLTSAQALLQTGFLALLVQGGLVMIPLLASSVLSLTVILGTGVKNPTVFELFGFAQNFRGNPNLGPEEGEGWAIGIWRRPRALLTLTRGVMSCPRRRSCKVGVRTPATITKGLPMMLRRLLTVCAVVALRLVAGSADAEVGAPAVPRRIVSLNLCTDQLVLALADRDAVRSVTWLARDPQGSVMATEAAQVPINYGLAEEIIPLAPDLVLAGAYTTRTTVALLKRFGVPLVEIDMPQSVPAIFVQLRMMARLLGHPERGDAMVAAMEAALTALGPPEAPRPVAAVYHPNGFTVGRGSLIDDLLTRAGLRNLAAELTLTNYSWLPLEVLLMQQPDLLVLNTRHEVAPDLAHEVLHHPSLATAFPRFHTLVMPPRLWACAGPWVVDAIARLRDAARRLAVAEVAR